MQGQEKEREKKKMKIRGITLVALVVTIVVLIILATISINIIFGEEGILEKAKQAKQDYANAQAEEEQRLAESANSMDEYITGEREQITVDKEEYEQLKETVENMNSEFMSDSGNIAITSTEKQTLKTFTNLTPGIYFVSYSQLIAPGAIGNVGIYINDELVINAQRRCF